MIIQWKQSVSILSFYCNEIISKAEPCLVDSIQNQLTLGIATMIVQQILVARKQFFGDCADMRNKIAESLWKQNYADAVHVLWISSSLWILFLNYLNSGMDYMEWRIQHKKLLIN